mmetsp:Transcript_46069/g.149614  ORF Transcript_46069/g.149614 Transcript_46069/m.149614 type:complete len:338 (-) Transcript_46069:314-1327(-)
MLYMLHAHHLRNRPKPVGRHPALHRQRGRLGSHPRDARPALSRRARCSSSSLGGGCRCARPALRALAALRALEAEREGVDRLLVRVGGGELLLEGWHAEQLVVHLPPAEPWVGRERLEDHLVRLLRRRPASWRVGERGERTVTPVALVHDLRMFAVRVVDADGLVEERGERSQRHGAHAVAVAAHVNAHDAVEEVDALQRRRLHDLCRAPPEERVRRAREGVRVEAVVAVAPPRRAARRGVPTLECLGLELALLFVRGPIRVLAARRAIARELALAAPLELLLGLFDVAPRAVELVHAHEHLRARPVASSRCLADGAAHPHNSRRDFDQVAARTLCT